MLFYTFCLFVCFVCGFVSVFLRKEVNFLCVLSTFEQNPLENDTYSQNITFVFKSLL